MVVLRRPIYDDGSTVTVEFHQAALTCRRERRCCRSFCSPEPAPTAPGSDRTYLGDPAEVQRVRARLRRVIDRMAPSAVTATATPCTSVIDDPDGRFHAVRRGAARGDPETGHVFFGEQEEHYIAWLPVVAPGRGRRGTHRRRTGYAKPRSGTGVSRSQLGQHRTSQGARPWYWGRARIGDHTVVTLMFVQRRRLRLRAAARGHGRQGRPGPHLRRRLDRISFTGGVARRACEDRRPRAPTPRLPRRRRCAVVRRHVRAPATSTLDFGAAGAYLPGSSGRDRRARRGRSGSSSPNWHELPQELLYFGDRTTAKPRRPASRRRRRRHVLIGHGADPGGTRTGLASWPSVITTNDLRRLRPTQRLVVEAAKGAATGHRQRAPHRLRPRPRQGAAQRRVRAGWPTRRRSSVHARSETPRTRLTHSLEVAQIGRGHGRSGSAATPTWSTWLAWPTTSAHPPYGHNGERALDEIGRRPSAASRATRRTCRILTRLEPKVLDAARPQRRAQPRPARRWTR